jgi:hypothetical protein
MKIFPSESCHTVTGLLRVAAVEGLPSPVEEPTPVPATVLVTYEGRTAEQSKEKYANEHSRTNRMEDLNCISTVRKKERS